QTRGLIGPTISRFRLQLTGLAKTGSLSPAANILVLARTDSKTGFWSCQPEPLILADPFGRQVAQPCDADTAGPQRRQCRTRSSLRRDWRTHLESAHQGTCCNVQRKSRDR